MPDIVAPHVRSRMMAGIRGRNTKPELLLRRGLHRRGFRFRLHSKGIPGKPDLVFPKYHAVIFANGCFWHGHDCALFRWPKSRSEFWRNKITGNTERDKKIIRELQATGWRILTVWECALKGSNRTATDAVVTKCASWLQSTRPSAEIKGRQ